MIRHEPNRPAAAGRSGAPLGGVKAAIVEDNFTVAQGLKLLLESLGCKVTAMAPTVERAREVLSHEPFDVAILDIDLRGTNVSPLAETLARENRRICFLSGYGERDLLPAPLRSFPRLDKPVEADVLVSAILGLLGRSDS